MKAKSLACLLLGFMLLSLVLVPVIPKTSAGSTPSIVIYAHQNGSPLNGGQDANTTSLFYSTAKTVSAGATSGSQFSTSWDLYPCLAASLTITGGIVFTVYLTGNTTTLSGVTLGAQVNEIASCGTGTETTLFGGEQTTTISISPTETKYQVTIPVSTNTAVPSGYSIHFIVYVNPNTVDTQTITLYYDASASNTNFALPINSAVTVNSLSLSPANIQGSGVSIATLSVSDAFGLYDVASHTLTATIPGVSVTPINAQAMTPSASNTQTAYTGTWTYSIDPSSTSYGSYGGLWNIQSSATDQSGNSYSSSVQQLTYSVGGSCISCTTTSSTQSNGGGGGIMSWTLFGFPAIYVLGVAIVIFVVAVIFVARRS
ncbi:MAG: hypothetical protein JRN15_05545 [Nitrososphaerota archaeon]|nr:hypothetical protein [Nitrososphaerota archaeon]